MLQLKAEVKRDKLGSFMEPGMRNSHSEAQTSLKIHSTYRVFVASEIEAFLTDALEMLTSKSGPDEICR